jgi:Uracil DNA glycosylase superfamily
MGMDGIFKQKLLGLRAPEAPRTFAEALLEDTSWLQKPARSSIPKELTKDVFSEKVQVIESLERFAQEKAAEQKTDVVKIQGGEVHLRPEPQWVEVSSFNSYTDLKDHLKLDGPLLDIVLSQKEAEKVKVLFISEKFRPWEEASKELKSGFINELIVGFPVKTAELFERMIMAMKLDSAEVIIFPVEGSDETDYAEDVMTVAAYYRPEVIITLGAKATNKVLKSNDRLTLIHGQFFARRIGDKETFQVVPLFHPSIIETNQNMKKTAWADMQKIMKFLKKLP